MFNKISAYFQIFKRPNQPKNSKRILGDTIQSIKALATGQTRIPLPHNGFITPEEEDEEPTAVNRTDVNQNNTTESCCTDYTAHGRCLGYHRPQEVPLNQTANSSAILSKINFNQTLNQSTACLGNSTWTNQLNTMPQVNPRKKVSIHLF